jgi:TPR repeat protein
MATAVEWTRTRLGPVACLVACCAWWNVAAAGRFDSMHRESVADPTRNYLPAKYYERVALDAMRRKDYAAVVSAYEQAAYWGNKVAQYDLGEIYLHGLGSVRADRARGVAWLGIADEEHQPDYDKALVGAYKVLKPGERKRAEALWKELETKYGDKLTLARATRAFEDAYHSGRLGSATTEGDPNTYTFSISGYDPAGNSVDAAALESDLTELGMRNGSHSLAGYWPARKKEFAMFISAQFGRVEVGAIEKPAPAEKKPGH